MNTGTKFLVAAVVSLGASTSAFADQWNHNPWNQGHHHDRYENRFQNRYESRDDYAQVIDVDPIVNRIRVSAPTRQCWNESQTVYTNPRSSVPKSTIVGTLIGGAVGHRIGQRTGHGNDPIAMIAGGLIGAAIGHDVGEHRDERRGAYAVPVERNVERCNVDYRESYEDRIEGYRVTYLYHGRTYTTRMPYDPGSTVRINVDVSPAWEGR